MHVATSLAVFIYFRHRFWSVILGLRNDPASRRLCLMLCLAFGVTAVLGLLLRNQIVAAFASPLLVGAMLVVTAVTLFSVRFIRPTNGPESLLSVGWKAALLVGLAQGLAVFPGLSRSGLTIVAGLWGGMGRTAAAEFSFLLAVPTILAASLFTLLREPHLTEADAGGLVLAGVVAFLAGLLAISWLMRWLQRGQLWWFSVYCVLVGVSALVVWGVGVL